MARITVEDCVKVIPNRFELIDLAARRARQLAMSGCDEAMVDDCKFHKPTVLALREIAEGFTNFQNHSVIREDEAQEIAQRMEAPPVSPDLPEGHWREGEA